MQPMGGVPIQKSGSDVGRSIATPMRSRQNSTKFPLRNNGKPYLRTANSKVLRAPEDPERLRKLQQMYGEKALGKAAACGASNVFNVPNVVGSVQDEDAWMRMTLLRKDGHSAQAYS